MRFVPHTPDALQDLPISATIDVADGDLNIMLHRGEKTVRIGWIDQDGAFYRAFVGSDTLASFDLSDDGDGRIALS